MGVKYPKKMYSFEGFLEEARQTQTHNNRKGKVKYTEGKKYYTHQVKGFNCYSIENRLGKTLWLDAKRFKKEYPKLI